LLGDSSAGGGFVLAITFGGTRPEALESKWYDFWRRSAIFLGRNSFSSIDHDVGDAP
jgi:hypothetical protein